MSTVATTELNRIRLTEALEMIGQRGLKEIHGLALRLGIDQPRWSARIAPSLVIQSEAELFSLSTPRFSVRYYFSNQSFINLRRIELMKEQLREYCFADRRSLPGIQPNPALFYYPYPEDLGRGTPCKVLDGCSCIGDGVLQVPQSLEKGNHFVKAPLGALYGEVWDRKQDYEGVPYLKHIPMAGGGLCAQAVCFMASCLLGRWAKCMYGLGEITYLANERPYPELCISGLTEAEMVQYFRKVGLSCTLQRPVQRQIPKPTAYLAQALAAYLRSNMPIIYPMDAGRMAGNFFDIEPRRWPPSVRPDEAKSIYGSNEIGTFGFGREPYPHVVLLIGVSNDGNTFFMNDPSTYPFVKANTMQLWRASSYDFTNNSGEEVGGLRNYLEEQVFMPVTPNEVKVPLLSLPDGDYQGHLNESWFLTESDLLDVRALAANLQEGKGQLAILIKTHLPRETKSLLSNWQSQALPENHLSSGLRIGLNQVLQSISLQTGHEVELSGNDLDQHKALVKANRLSLSQAYPNQVGDQPHLVRDGLMDRVEKFLAMIPAGPGHACRRFEHLLLKQVKDLRTAVCALPKGEGVWNKVGTDISMLSSSTSHGDDHWTWMLWVKRDLHSNLLFFDAERPIESAELDISESAKLHLLLEVETVNGVVQKPKWFVSPLETIKRPAETNCPPMAPLPQHDLNLGLISSFCGHGLSGEARDGIWPKSPAVHFGELYAFMQWDRLLEMDGDTFQPDSEAQAQTAEELCQIWQDELSGVYEEDLRDELALIRRNRELRSIRRLISKLRGPPSAKAEPRNAVSWAAELGNDESRIKSLANRISEECKELGIKLRAFATFVPEASSSEPEAHKSASEALACFVRLAKELNVLGQEVRCIELVGGSLIDGLWPAFDKRTLVELVSPDNPNPSDAELETLVRNALATGKNLDGASLYGANIKPPEQARWRFVQAVASAVQREDPGKNLTFGAELQPGPFYVLGDFVRIQGLCELLELAASSTDPGIKRAADVLGLNLDLPHWAILGTYDHSSPSPRPIAASDAMTQPVFCRLTHSHLSDHSCGHFCDNTLGSHHPDIVRVFGPWVDVLVKRGAQRDGSSLPFSQTTTVELEMAKDLGMVEECIQRARQELGYGK